MRRLPGVCLAIRSNGNNPAVHRNGILLCDVAATVTGTPVKRVIMPPRDVRAARANILLALDHLGLLQDFDESHMVGW